MVQTSTLRTEPSSSESSKLRGSTLTGCTAQMVAGGYLRPLASLESQYLNPIVRETTRSETGTYCFDLQQLPTGQWLAQLIHWQDNPEDEAAELTVIDQYMSLEYAQCYKWLVITTRAEAEKGYPGYKLSKRAENIVRVRNSSAFKQMAA